MKYGIGRRPGSFIHVFTGYRILQLHFMAYCLLITFSRPGDVCCIMAIYDT